MAAQAGFEYEKNVAKILQKLDPAWVSSLYIPAGAGSDKPDLELLLNNKDYGCELKMKAKELLMIIALCAILESFCVDAGMGMALGSKYNILFKFDLIFWFCF